MRLGLLVLSLAVGCGECASEPRARERSAVEPAPEPPAPVGPTGTVRGVVRLAEGAELPEYTLAQIAGVGERPERPESCGPPQQSERQPLRLGENRGLSYVAVVATASDSDAFAAALGPRSPARHAVSIRDCRLDPPVVVATRGDLLVVTNEMDYPFLPTLGGSSFMQALLKDQEREITLTRGGVIPLQCAFAAPCGRSDVIVALHPVHTASGIDGRFELPNVPADLPIQVNGWHPLLKETHVSVRVPAGGAVDVELVLEPIEVPAAAPPGEPPVGHPEDQPGMLF